MAIPALAPPVAAFALEGIGGLAGRWLARGPAAPPAGLVEAPIVRRGGDSEAARLGRLAHQQLKERVAQKGWEPEPRINLPDGSFVRPDVRTPRNYQMELKPNTPSGRRAAIEAAKRYQRLTKNRTRGIFYDPKDIE